MSTYEVYVDDDRYRVPSLYLITAETEQEARDRAVEIWRESPHHRGAELLRDGERLWGVGTLAVRPHGSTEEPPGT